MKLKKFNEKDSKRIGIIAFTITCILLISGAILYRTFAIFEVKTNQNVIKGTVQDPGNLYFAFYVDNVIQKEMPDKDSGYVLDEVQSYCGVNGEKDENIEVYLTEDWFIHVGNMKTSRTKCTLYFVKGKFFNGKGIPVVEEGNGLYIVEHTDSELDDEWKKTEYRYAGEDPNNYVWFNEELWRMIGFVNVKTSDGHVEQRVKIIKGNNNGSLAWDSSRSNDWTKASLMTYLNGEYHDQFKDRSKNMVDEGIIWSIGAGNSDLSYTPNNFYETERGTTTYNSQPSEWKKETENDFHSIGLMYPSDYGWASTGVIDNKRCFKPMEYRH